MSIVCSFDLEIINKFERVIFLNIVFFIRVFLINLIVSITRIIIVCAIAKNMKTNVIVKITRETTTTKKIDDAIITKKTTKVEIIDDVIVELVINILSQSHVIIT